MKTNTPQDAKKLGNYSISNNKLQVNYQDGIESVLFEEIASISNKAINNPIVIFPLVCYFLGLIIIFINLSNTSMILLGIFIIILGMVLIFVARKKWDNIIILTHTGNEIVFSVEFGKGDEIVKKLSSNLQNIFVKKQIEIINEKEKRVDTLSIQLQEVQTISIPEITDFKKVIIVNEESIVSRGGDNQLFTFMKLDSFLRDFRGRIISDQAGLNDIIDVNDLKRRVKRETQRVDLDKIIENLDDRIAGLDGKQTKRFDANLAELFQLGNVMKPSMENQIKTMEYYKGMALAMLVFYLSEKKIRYFEIYEAFEKLGVFDSTWQKNVLNKLDNIELRLAQISSQLTELNQNFITLVEASENIVFELNKINNNIMNSKMLQAIATYQTWRINKGIRSH